MYIETSGPSSLFLVISRPQFDIMPISHFHSLKALRIWQNTLLGINYIVCSTITNDMYPLCSSLKSVLLKRTGTIQTTVSTRHKSSARREHPKNLPTGARLAFLSALLLFIPLPHPWKGAVQIPIVPSGAAATTSF